LLIPVTEVGSMAAASGWLAATVSFLCVETRPGKRLVALAGAAVALLFVAMKVVPVFPGHFSRAEWVALAAWLALGTALHLARRPQTARV